MNLTRSEKLIVNGASR